VGRGDRHDSGSVMRSFFFLGAGLLAGSLVFGCAEGQVDFRGQGGDGGSSPSTGGQGVGGSGGQGGALPCGIDCSAIMAPTCLKSVCNEGQYLGPVGSCVVVDDDAGASCDDGLFCTTSDTCNGMGDCVGGPANDCGMDPEQCQQVQCNESSQNCSLVPSMNGTFCTPTDLCLVNATCQGGSCSGGTPKDCFFAPVPNECYVAVCDPADGQCKPQIGPGGNPCTDASDLCTVNKVCDNMGNCMGGSPKNCSAFTMGCNVGMCDTMTGNCFGQPVNDGDPCDDLDYCTTGELCSMGNCSGGVPIVACVSGDNCCPPGCDDPLDMDCAAPLPCTTGNFGVDPGGDPWVVCQADSMTAWVSANIQGTYHITDICQFLGYNIASQWGGTCGSVCGYCEFFTSSCMNLGQRLFDGSTGCNPPITHCSTVMWECSQ
jgi:hypothetical protein